MRRGQFVPAMLAAASLMGGCVFGGGNDPDDLVEKLPADNVPGVVALDLDEAREELGLDEDADPGDVDIANSSEKDRRFAILAAGALAHLSMPSPTPIREALDEGQIDSAAATLITFSPQALTVVHTDQDFDDIADSLITDGYKRDGDVLTSEDPVRALVYSVVGGKDDLVYMGMERETIEDAMDRDDPEDGLSGARDLLDEVDGPLRAAMADDVSCIKGFAMSDEAKERPGGQLAVKADDASEDRFKADDDTDVFPFRGWTFDDIEVDGDLLTARYELPEDSPPVAGIGFIRGNRPENAVYDCG